jgi:hypothetical protein
MKATDLMIEKALLRLLDAMAQEGVPIRTILMRAVADGVVADPSSEVTEYLDADKLVQRYVDVMTNRFTGDAR